MKQTLTHSVSLRVNTERKSNVLTISHLDRIIKTMPKTTLIIFTSLIILAAILGYLLGNRKPVLQSISPSLKKAVQDKKPSLFQTQIATFKGKITSASGSTLTVVNDQNQSGQFPVSKKLVVYDQKSAGQKSAGATPSSDLKSIQTNQPVLLVLEYIDGDYQAISATFLPK